MTEYGYYSTSLPKVVEAILTAWAWEHIEDPSTLEVVDKELYINYEVVARAVINYRGYVYTIGVTDEKHNGK